MPVSAAVLIRTSMQDLGVLGAGEPGDGLALQDGLRRLQVLLAAWALDPLTVVQTDREVFPIVSMQQTYTIGPGLELDTARPVGQQSIVGAGLLLEGSSPPVELPRAVLTYAMYQGLQIKDLVNSLFTSVFYRPGALAPPAVPLPPSPSRIGASEIILWPVPTQATPLVLYIERVMPLFENLTTIYPLPESYEAAIQYNLTVALAPMFSVQVPEEIARMARITFAAMKRNNYQFTDVAIDPMFTMQTPGAKYSINSGAIRRG